MTKFKVLLASLLMLAGIGLTTAPAPATAAPAPAAAVAALGTDCTWGTFCGTVRHYAPDNGYDTAFLVSCNLTYQGFTDVHYVAEGQSSTSICKDVDGFYVNPGARYRCFDGGGWGIVYDETGWHKITNIVSILCVYELD